MPGPCTTSKSSVGSTARSCVRGRPKAPPIQRAARNTANPIRAGPRSTLSSNQPLVGIVMQDCRHIPHGD
jgi:hypothetical protein